MKIKTNQNRKKIKHQKCNLLKYKKNILNEMQNKNWFQKKIKYEKALRHIIDLKRNNNKREWIYIKDYK